MKARLLEKITAKKYNAKANVSIEQPEDGIIITYNVSTRQVNSRTGDKAGVRTNGKLDFRDESGNQIASIPSEDGRITGNICTGRIDCG